MRQAKFMLALVLLVGLGAAFYWFSTKGTREAAKSAMVEPPPKSEQDPATMWEEAPADSAAMADTVSVH